MRGFELAFVGGIPRTLRECVTIAGFRGIRNEVKIARLGVVRVLCGVSERGDKFCWVSEARVKGSHLGGTRLVQ